MSKDKRSGNGNGPGAARPSNGHPKPPAGQPVKTYVEGQPFPGRIGRTWDVSEPAFPVAPTPPKGAPNILYIVLDDVGFGWSSTFGGLVETPNITKLADNGLTLHQLPHDRALLADARVPAHGPQPPLGRHGEHHRARHGLPRLQRPPAARTRRPSASILHQHGYTSFALGKWHNTAVRGDGRRADRTTAGRAAASSASTASTASSAATRTSGTRSSTSIASRSISRACPRRAITSPKTSPIGPMSFIGNQQSIDPDRPWLCHFAFGACHAPHHVAKEWSDQYKGKFDMGWDKYREIVLERQKKLGVVPQNAELSADARGRAEVGRPLGRREAPLRAHGRGLRRLPRARRRADRPPHRRSSRRPRRSTTRSSSSSSATTARRAKARSTASTTRCRWSRPSPKIPRRCSRRSTTSACPARTTTIRSAGRWRATRRSSCASSTRTSAERGIRSSCTGRRASRPRARFATSFTT